MSREAMELALEALENSRPINQNSVLPHNKHVAAITALREALAQPQPEPVGEITMEDIGRPFNSICIRTHFYECVPPVGTKLYTHPPAQTQKDTVGPSGDRLSDFRVDQWWFLELDKAFKNGTAEQKQAVAVVRNLLATIQTHLQEPPTE